MLPFSVLTKLWNFKIWKPVRMFPVTNIPSQNPKVVMAYSPIHKLLAPLIEALIIKIYSFYWSKICLHIFEILVWSSSTAWNNSHFICHNSFSNISRKTACFPGNLHSVIMGICCPQFLPHGYHLTVVPSLLIPPWYVPLPTKEGSDKSTSNLEKLI